MEEILIEVFDTTLEDLQLAITLNPSIENISLAMEQYATMRVKEEREKGLSDIEKVLLPFAGYVFINAPEISERFNTVCANYINNQH